MPFTTVDAGAARTRIRVQRSLHTDDGTGNEIDTWEDVSTGAFACVWRRKLTRFDSAADDTKEGRVIAPETATVTMRYTKRITADCRVKRVGDEGGWWEVIGTPERSVDGGWLEFTVERRVRSV